MFPRHSHIAMNGSFLAHSWWIGLVDVGGIWVWSDDGSRPGYEGKLFV